MFPKTFEHQTTKVQNLLPKPRQTTLVFSLWWFINVVFHWITTEEQTVIKGKLTFITILVLFKPP